MADGHLIRQIENGSTFTESEQGTLERIAQFPLTAPDSTITQRVVFAFMLMIATAVAMCDEHIDKQELLLPQSTTNGGIIGSRYQKCEAIGTKLYSRASDRIYQHLFSRRILKPLGTNPCAGF